MAWESESKSPWYMRLTIHLILAGGAVFFLLPLVWMMATSFKPLSDTMTPPQSAADVFLGKGYRAAIEGKTYEVVPERDVVPTQDHPFYIVTPASTFLAGELWLSNGPEEWKKYSTFNEQELSVMMVTVTSTDRVLADENNTYDPAAKTLTLESGRKLPATLVREIQPSPRTADQNEALRNLAAMQASLAQAVAALPTAASQAPALEAIAKNMAAGNVAQVVHDQNDAESALRLTAVGQHPGDEPAKDKPAAAPKPLSPEERAALVKLAYQQEQIRQKTQDILDQSKLRLVREWRPEDTDAKEGAPPSREITRPWDVLPASQIQNVLREIPQNYPVALSRVGFLKALLNTLFLCCMCVGGAVVSSVLVAYGFSFIEFRGRNLLFGLTVATMMIPFVITMIPVYLLYRDLGWVGTFKPLWVTAWFGGAFFIFLLRQFFLGLPKDLLDAARIDGCTELEILWHVIVPLSRPAIAMVALFTFLGTWKDFMGPLIYLMHPEQYTLSLSLQVFYAEHGGTPWHLLMAASTMFSLPLVILFFLTMKTFIRGIAMTGIKG